MKFTVMYVAIDALRNVLFELKYLGEPYRGRYLHAHRARENCGSLVNIKD